MPKKQKTKEQFQKDVLLITAAHDKDIKGLKESFVLFSEDMAKRMDEAIETVKITAKNIVQVEQPQQQTPVICAVLATPQTVMPEEELLKRAGDIAKIIKPVMLKHDMAKIVVTIKK